MGVWMAPRAGLDDLEKRKFFTLPGLEFRPLRRPARSQSLYRIRYLFMIYIKKLNPETASIYINKKTNDSPLIIGKRSPFWVISFGTRFCVFTSLDFATIVFYLARSSAFHPTPHNLKDQVLVFMSPSDRVAQVWPQAPCFPFHRLCDSQRYGRGVPTCLHTEMTIDHHTMKGNAVSSSTMKVT
jgi:hypothetical protein